MSPVLPSEGVFLDFFFSFLKVKCLLTLALDGMSSVFIVSSGLKRLTPVCSPEPKRKDRTEVGVSHGDLREEEHKQLSSWCNRIHNHMACCVPLLRALATVICTFVANWRTLKARAGRKFCRQSTKCPWACSLASSHYISTSEYSRALHVNGVCVYFQNSFFDLHTQRGNLRVTFPLFVWRPRPTKRIVETWIHNSTTMMV